VRDTACLTGFRRRETSVTSVAIITPHHPARSLVTTLEWSAYKIIKDSNPVRNKSLLMKDIVLFSNIVTSFGL